MNSPLRLYRSLKSSRDWLLAKIEYLQTESAKWRGLFNVLRSPYSLLRALGLSPQLCMTVLVGGSLAGGGVVVNETLLDGPSFSRGDSGVYLGGQDSPIYHNKKDNTLRLILNEAPMGEVTITNATAGTAFAGSALPVGETNVLIVGGLPASGAIPETFVETEYLLIKRNRCTQMILTDISAHEFNIEHNASDGQSITFRSGNPRKLSVTGGASLESVMRTPAGQYDQIKVHPAEGVTARVVEMRFEGLLTRGGPCVWSRIIADVVDVIGNEVGAGDGFENKDLVVDVICTICNSVDNREIVVTP